MITCKICRGTKVKSRTNYSHGKKSSSITTFVCDNCGLLKAEPKHNHRYRRRR